MSGNHKKRMRERARTRKEKHERDLMVATAVNETKNISAVAKEFSLNRQTIYAILKRVDMDGSQIDRYRLMRSQVNTLNQLRRQELQDVIIDSFNIEEVKNFEPRVKMHMLHILGLDKHREYEQERLETGQSTENVAVIVAAIKDAKRRTEGDNG